MRVPAIAPQALAFNPSVAAQIPDVVSGVIAGPGMQVSLVNGGDVSLTNGSGSVVASAVLTAKGDVVAADVVTGAATFGSVQPGQAFGVVVTLSPVGGDIPCGDGQHVVVTLAFSAMTSQLTNVTTAPVNATLQCSVFNASQPYRFTFIDAGDGSIQVTKHRNATCSNCVHVHRESAPGNRFRCCLNRDCCRLAVSTDGVCHPTAYTVLITAKRLPGAVQHARRWCGRRIADVDWRVPAADAGVGPAAVKQRRVRL